jgi:hypothetical protein
MSLASSGRPVFLQAKPVPEKLARDGPGARGLLILPLTTN